MKQEMERNHYKHLIITTLINAIIMYFVMYTMIEKFSDFYNNINQVYMVLMMAAPMITIMLVDMKTMFMDKKRNMILHAVSVALVVLGFIGMRTQAAVGNEQFLKAMIPHHSGAILMCREASISDPEILKLCDEIEVSQQREIDRMKAILERY